MACTCPESCHVTGVHLYPFLTVGACRHGIGVHLGFVLRVRSHLGLLMLGIVGLPVPDEALLTFIGHLNFRGELMLAPSIASAFLGSACGISLSYTLGRLVGPALLTKLSGKLLVNPEHIAKAQQWVQRWGKYTLLIAYFVPGVRHFATLTIGVSKLPLGIFMRFAYAGALLWFGTFIMIG